jgi:hypothetical protein
MLKPLLSLCLVLSQLLAAGDAPLYLCLGSDEPLCIDFGPASCDCCQHDSHDGGAESDDHCHASSGAVLEVRSEELQIDAPCDCAHVQLSRQHGPSLLSASATAHAKTVLSANLASVCLSAPGRIDFDPATASSWQVRGDCYPPTADSKPLILRC